MTVILNRGHPIKVAVWQSADSYGFVKIMGTLDKLPKITRRGQLIGIRQVRGKRERNYREKMEDIAVLAPQFTTHREILIMSGHESDWQNLYDSQARVFFILQRLKPRKLLTFFKFLIF